MKNEKWNDSFIKALYEKYPQKSQLMKELSDLLHIEREAVYRRLRQDVIFSMQEVVKISAAWNISLDQITNIYSGLVPFFMQPVNYLEPSDQELKFLRHIIYSINLVKDEPDTEFRNICNKLPRQFLTGFEQLYKFNLFRWMYKYGNGKYPVPFSQVNVSEEKIRLKAEYYSAIKNVPKSNFLFDENLFEYLINDIRYFHSIKMITCEEKKYIKNDLFSLLNYLKEVARSGCYPETNNEVNLYISRLTIDTNYSYVLTKLANICFVHVFDTFEIHTYEPDMVANFKTWMQLKQRSAIQISGVDEKSQIDYFEKQYRTVSSL